MDQNLGAVGIVIKDWNILSQYTHLNQVQYLGSSYTAFRKDQPVPIGTLPTDPTWWKLSATKGATGDKGENAVKGTATAMNSPVGSTRYEGETYTVATPYGITLTNYGNTLVPIKIGSQYVSNARVVYTSGAWSLQKELIDAPAPGSDGKDLSENVKKIDSVSFREPVTTYGTTGSTAAGSLDEVFIDKRVFTENRTYSKIYLKIGMGTLEDADVRFYVFDSTLKVVSSSAVINIVKDTTQLFYSIDVNMSVPKGCYLGVAWENVAKVPWSQPAGNGSGVFWKSGLITNLALATGYQVTGTSNLTGTFCVGWEGTTENGLYIVKSLDDELKTVEVAIKEKNILSDKSYNNVGASPSQGYGELWVKNKIYANGAEINTLKIFISGVDTSKTTFGIQVYTFDATSLYINNKSAFITVPYTVAGVYSIDLGTLVIPKNSRVGVAMEYGVRMFNLLTGGGGVRFGGGTVNVRPSKWFDLPLNYNASGVTTNLSTWEPSFGFDGYEYGTGYLDIRKYYSKTQVDELVYSSQNNNYLRGKKIIAIGDSMVDGQGVARDNIWLGRMALRNGGTYINYGINGTYLSNRLYNATYQGAVIRYTAMDNDADYILVFAGTNDARAPVPMGTDTSTDDTTFKGALNVLCDGLITKYPNKKIGFITPYYVEDAFLPYIEAIETMCAKYSIPVFNNARRGGIRWTNTAQTSALRMDTLHLNVAGHDYASYKYEEWLRSL